MTARKNETIAYKIGYYKYHRPMKFRQGQSGNPGERSRRPATERVKALALREGYRRITMREAGKALALPAIQAILRSQVRKAISLFGAKNSLFGVEQGILPNRVISHHE
jgi:hypothetical protein